MGISMWLFQQMTRFWGELKRIEWTGNRFKSARFIDGKAKNKEQRCVSGHLKDFDRQ